MAVVLQATWVARPGSEDLVREALAELAPKARAEQGNLAFWVSMDPDQPSTFRLYEIYADHEALDQHTESDHFQSIVVGRVLPELDERRREFFDLLDL
jgi:quinol monooxygenase YgiN